MCVRPEKESLLIAYKSSASSNSTPSATESSMLSNLWQVSEMRANPGAPAHWSTNEPAQKLCVMISYRP